MRTVFNGLETSSIRLDQKHFTEVGASTFLFSPIKDTNSKILFQHILNLFRLNIVGDSELEGSLVELADICTQQLKAANESIKKIIVDCLKELET
jgi:hypothetical protein